MREEDCSSAIVIKKLFFCIVCQVVDKEIEVKFRLG